MALLAQYFRRAVLPASLAASQPVRLMVAVCVLALSGCASHPLDFPMQNLTRDNPLPGDAVVYDWGLCQTATSAATIARAQKGYMWSGTRDVWHSVEPNSRPVATDIGLQRFYPLSVRWQLKDGRQFLLDKADLRPVMKTYFSQHSIVMPWQRENRRAKSKPMDSNPMLCVEVKDDGVLIKWVVVLSHLQEKSDPRSPGVPDYKFSYEHYPVTTLKGQPTAGIDFEKWMVFHPPAPQK